MILKLSRSMKATVTQWLVALGIAQRLFEAVLEQRAVGQAGERVVVRHEADALFAELALDGDAGDVAGGLADREFFLVWRVRGLVVEGEHAERLVVRRDDRDRPARPVGVRRDEVAAVGPERIAQHVGDDDGVAAMHGGAAGGAASGRRAGRPGP